MPAVVWFRRDLRVHDHPALSEAVREHDAVICLFVLDPKLLEGRFASANRTAYLHDCLAALDGELRERGGRLDVVEGVPEEVVPAVADGGPVYASEDVSPYARARDARVAERADLRLRPGLFIADLDDLRTQDGRPFSVFSPFRRAWEAQERRPVHNAPSEVPAAPWMKQLCVKRVRPRSGEGRELVDRPEPGEAAAKAAAKRWIASHLDGYGELRGRLDVPTSRMSQYLHFGCLSPRWLEERVLAHGGPGAAAYRAELAWRDFYAAVLQAHPRVLREAYRRELDELEWDDDAEALQAWKEGRTGYPLVDAGMRQLAACGWMHNRARMVVASFLTKDLHLDWRLGEAHFMEHLIDGDVASNNGGWQWTAGTGTDPSPFHRVFNPARQQERFDPEGAYVRRWVPELARVPLERLAEPWAMPAAEQEAYGCLIGKDYPEPIVDHAVERRRALDRYAAVGGVSART